MGKLSNADLVAELASKKLTLSDTTKPYENLSSPITVLCENQHTIETNLKTIRMANFKCPVCAGASSKNDAASTHTIPPKKGYRIIGIDNATQRFGISMFENGKLIYYNLFTFSGDVVSRLNQIRDLLENIIIPIWEPDFIEFEDVQLQGQAFATYEVLVKLVGLLEMSCDRFGISYEKIRSNIWRSHFVINGKDRQKEKEKAIQLVKQMYSITVGDDVAEAILIGKFRVDLKNRTEIKNLF